jgi:hypothetical protein
MNYIWIVIAVGAVCAYVAGVIKGRHERRLRIEYEKYKYTPYTTRGFNILYVFESDDSFCISDDPEYYLHSSPEEDFELPDDLPIDEYQGEDEEWSADEESITTK